MILKILKAFFNFRWQTMWYQEKFPVPENGLKCSPIWVKYNLE